MPWIKKGLIIKPGKADWMLTHIQNPFGEWIDQNIIRIYFAGRDHQNRARGGYADIDMQDSCRVVGYSSKPILDLGELGCFDDCGVMPSSIVNFENKKYMYYTGWSQAVATPFTFFIGLAISEDGGKTYSRYSKAPILGRNFFDPYLTASPFVLWDHSIWKMWYVSGIGWKLEKGKRPPKHYYLIKCAYSKNGIQWETNDKISIHFKKDEYSLARPVVCKNKNLYEMYFSYRGGKAQYQIGYAESVNGEEWTRMDEKSEIVVSDSGWDSEMICYPFVFEYRGKKHMIYNGNEYGKFGAGLAVYH